MGVPFEITAGFNRPAVFLPSFGRGRHFRKHCGGSCRAAAEKASGTKKYHLKGCAARPVFSLATSDTGKLTGKRWRFILFHMENPK
ncbi:MAG: hypothetical protein IJT50_11320, partial [Lentisphaeria bacterium]|nr:hypothetical protein [Lentisphaeria bacterium]